jgi:uncharacterized MAPEG superfamily protein
MRLTWISIVLALAPFAWMGVTIFYRVKQLGGVDFRNPDQQALQLSERGARAYHAQHHGWHALVLFGAAAFVANLAGVPERTIFWSGVIYVIARALQSITFFLGLLSPLHVVFFVVGLIPVAYLFVRAVL